MMYTKFATVSEYKNNFRAMRLQKGSADCLCMKALSVFVFFFCQQDTPPSFRPVLLLNKWSFGLRLPTGDNPCSMKSFSG